MGDYCHRYVVRQDILGTKMPSIDMRDMLQKRQKPQYVEIIEQNTTIY